jgi:hypothetical protein
MGLCLAYLCSLNIRMSYFYDEKTVMKICVIERPAARFHQV